MYQVIDTIRYDEHLFKNYPELRLKFGRGLFVILNPDQVRVAPFQPGDTVSIHRPDGTTIQQIVGGIELGAESVVGVYFAEMAEGEIPRFALIELSSKSKPGGERKLGTMRGSVDYMSPDFDAPLEDFREYM